MGGMCMQQGSVSNGTLSVGGVDTRLADKGQISYVADSGFAFHGVNVESIEVGGRRVAVKQDGILDTGTNVLVVPTDLYSELEKAMCADPSLPHCHDFWASKCFALSDAEVSKFPQLTSQLNRTTLKMNSRDYLLHGSPLSAS